MRTVLAVLMLAGCGGEPASPVDDLAAPRDLRTSPDLAAPDLAMLDLTTAMDLSPLPDVSLPVDLASPEDLATAMDLSPSTDLMPAMDLSPPPDLMPAMDLSPPPDLMPAMDLSPPPDLMPAMDLSPPPDLAPTCGDKVKNGSETDVDCGGSCPPCGLGKACATGADCAPALCRAKVCRHGNGCNEIKLADGNAKDGVHTVDLDGGGAGAPIKVYCDMTGDGGGWTLVMNQVPGMLLPDVTADVNGANFGAVGQSWRVGNPTITTIVPSLAWKLTDATNRVYFKPACKVDWTVTYSNQPASVCTTGYTTTGFTNVVNGAFVDVFTRGIGINNSAQFCSIRAYHTTQVYAGVVFGNAASCNFTLDQRVSLWFK